MMFQRDKSTSNISTLIERKSRFTILLKNRSRHAQVVMSGIREALLLSVPYSGRKTITFDRGSEFMAHTMLVEYLNVKSYYCEPQSPWQKGTVENINGRLRKFISRSANVNLLTDQDLSKSSHIINNTPCKCLNYRTPQKIFLLKRVAC